MHDNLAHALQWLVILKAGVRSRSFHLATATINLGLSLLSEGSIGLELEKSTCTMWGIGCGGVDTKDSMFVSDKAEGAVEFDVKRPL